jgi:glycosyltransferase involved in cell wall biosynthesis
MPNESVPLVAIVTPVFNGAKYLAETMESVQALTYPRLVHIVLDNASTDETPNIIARYQHAKVPLLTARRSTTCRMGINWSQAVGMTPAEAKYFRILCADDTLRPDAITGLVNVAEHDAEIGLVGCLWRAEGLCGEELPVGCEVFGGTDIIRSYLRREHSALSGMHMLVRRTELDRHSPFYDDSLASSFDADANLRICMRSKFGFVREELGTWRIHPDSATVAITTKTFTSETGWLILLDRYGPQVLGFREYLECRTRYRRHLLRRLLKARFLEGNREAFTGSLQRLRDRDDAAGLLDFTDALVDWGLLALTRRRHLVGLPRRPTPQHATRLGVNTPTY